MTAQWAAHTQNGIPPVRSVYRPPDRRMLAFSTYWLAHTNRKGRTCVPRGSQLVALVLPCLLMMGCGRSNDDQFRLAVKNVRAGRTSSIDVRESPMVDDSLLSELRGLETLEKLNLDKTPVTDEGLAAIGELPNLRDLSLSRTQISNAAVSTIVINFPELVSLRLDETVITDLGIKKLTDSHHLLSLSLFRVPVTDSGCKDLAKITTLERLSLDQAMITDRGLAALKSLPNLKRLSIWQCQISNEGVESFELDRPDIAVNR